MRQTFDIKGGPQDGRAHLPLLRKELGTMGLDGFYVPHDDEYQNEYLPDANERLAWVSGFTGSFGSAFVFTDKAVIFADGRYTIQAADQTAPELWDREAIPEPGAFGWLAKQKLSGKKVGYDPRLMSPNDVTLLEAAAKKSGAELIAVEENPIDKAWADRPPQPMAEVAPYHVKYAGVAHDEKRAEIGKALEEDGIDAAVLTSPASLAWAFNIRGGDVMCTPLPLGRAILHKDGSADLFLDEAKVSPKLRKHLGNTVTVRPLSEIDEGLGELSGKTVSLDPDLASAWFFDTVEAAGGKIVRQRDPVALPRACKNEAEIKGTTAAHIRDGVALTRFLHWLDTEAQSGKVTEIEAAIRLENFRDEYDSLKDLSFPSISGAVEHGALPHYRVSEASDRTLELGSLYLIDSGGQYPDGTTDVTRTVPIGEPTADMIRHYTLVLKGHISLATVRFPEGTTGTHLDTLARHALWQAGLDYQHGTGHGVGVYLGVHEGPHRIAKAWNAVPLMPGMIVSNEPGYYREGQYGIRIENLQYVTPPAPIEGGEIDMLGFECLTFAPLARDLIDVKLLTKEERKYVNDYHKQVWKLLNRKLPDDVKAWLKDATKRI
ncbi:aminopeptidase P family protein [Hyphomonas sp. CY54-11-8]|uniref:aminopeptidase P family protein n=2 Tax=unclassified Hyphomonas TaxID=2630699 RepID=UPI0004590D7B|nr:aminopeptidase P family protein [Hyphomonas sp. CY54-11-8]KCZ45415.1 X-Pro aminopeptidase [Hyphomonas sp. CY54-11-8]